MAKARQRANGSGSVFKLKSGRWRAQYKPPVEPGEPYRPLSRNARTRNEALEKLDELRREAQTARDGRALVSVFLADWLGRQTHLKRSTHSQYETAIGHLTPAIGFHQLDALSPKILDDHFRGRSENRTAQVCYDVLRVALNYAVRMEMIGRNPLAAVSRPKVQREDINPFTAEQALLLMDATAGKLKVDAAGRRINPITLDCWRRWHAFIVLGLTIGPRQGEMFGLDWSDVDLDKGLLTIRKQIVEVSGHVYEDTPKTADGTRTVMLPSVAVDSLWKHRALLLKEKLASSPRVFPAREGAIARRGNIRVRFWNVLLSRLGLEHRGAHHLRHTFATLALGAGIPVHVVSSILGHSKPSTTLDLYAHSIAPQQADAMAKIQSILCPFSTADSRLTRPSSDSPQLQSG